MSTSVTTRDQMTDSFGKDEGRSTNFGHVNVLAYLAYLADICFIVHQKIPPCVRQFDFETSFGVETRAGTQVCPAHSHYKSLFEEKRPFPLVDRTKYSEPWLADSIHEVNGPMELSQQYIETSVSQLADYLAQEFENPLMLFEYKNYAERGLEVVIRSYIKMTEDLCLYMPKLLSDIQEFRSDMDQQKAALFNSDIDGDRFRACMKEELETIKRYTSQVSKAFLVFQSGDYLIHTLDDLSTMNFTLGQVKMSIEERHDKLSKIQCFMDLSELRALCHSLKDSCTELIHMTEVINFEDSSTEGSWTSNIYSQSREEQVLYTHDSGSETALDSASHFSK